MVIIIGLFIWYLFYNRERWLALIKNIRLTRSIHYSGLAIGGMLLGYQIEGDNFYGVFSNPADYLACASLALAIFFAFQAMIVANDLIDVQSDRISNPGRPLVRGLIPPEEYKAVGWIYLTLSLSLAFYVSTAAFFIVICFNALYLVYSAPPLRIKRFFPLNMLVIGINSLLAALLGYSLFGGVKTFDLFPGEFKLLIPLSFFLGANIITLKDRDADRTDGVKTLPTILGAKWGKITVALLALASFLSVPLILGIPLLWPLAATFGLIAAGLVLLKKWSETLFFITYFIYVLIAVILYAYK